MRDGGVILKGIGGLYTVYEAGAYYSCTARGVLRHDGVQLRIGDRVILAERDENTGSAVIDTVLPRKNELIRPKVANLDKLILVLAAGSPRPDLYLVDKMLITAERNGILPVLFINKSDQDTSHAAELYDQYRNAAHCYITCAADGTGIAAALSETDGAVSVLAGQSGVGKSTFLNLAVGNGRMETGGLSDKTQRGRHTTRHAELFPVSEKFATRPSFLIDSPGFSMLELNILPRDLPDAYPEVYNNKGECRFQDCSHTGEPGCFVTELVRRGVFHPERYVRYRELYKTLLEKEKNKYRSGKG